MTTAITLKTHFLAFFHLRHVKSTCFRSIDGRNHCLPIAQQPEPQSTTPIHQSLVFPSLKAINAPAFGSISAIFPTQIGQNLPSPSSQFIGSFGRAIFFQELHLSELSILPSNTASPSTPYHRWPRRAFLAPTKPFFLPKTQIPSSKNMVIVHVYPKTSPWPIPTIKRHPKLLLPPQLMMVSAHIKLMVIGFYLISLTQ